MKKRKIIKVIIVIILIFIITGLTIFFVLRNVSNINSKKARIVETISLNKGVTVEQIKNNNSGPTIVITENSIIPKSFMVESQALVSLAIISDNQDHQLVFAEELTDIEKIELQANEAQTIIFKAPTPGKYSFYCTKPGHQEKGEVGEMIVSIKPKDDIQANILKDEVKIPGASLVINNSLIQPDSFIVAPEAKISLTISSGDNRDHYIIFSDSTLKLGEHNVGFNKKKTFTFTTPRFGQYEFHCTIPGHEKESGIMIIK